MTDLGRFTVSTALLAALMAMPCVCAALPAGYEPPDALCHDQAESAYQLATARGDGLPDGAYEEELASCQYFALRAHMVASPSVSLRELVEFDWADADDVGL